MRWTLLLFLFILPFVTQAQDESNEVVQFSGLIVYGDSLAPVPFASVYRVRDRQGTVTDTRGFFTIPVLKGDTIQFSSVGFQPSRMVVSDTLSSNRYNVVQYMSKDTIFVETAFVYPWPTKAALKQELLALNLYEDEAERARKNLESIMMYNRMTEMGMDGGENYKFAMQAQTQSIRYAGQVPPQNIFNPVAWAQFVEAWRNGAFKKKK
ncbi:MAG: carboxypeptidase-like regulatory domain-containing protein [Flavobacteriales bacterium]|nr:carboxypeptidase-like regulatory domain-containing protein [Flavobacteriales bacterium]